MGGPVSKVVIAAAIAVGTISVVATSAEAALPLCGKGPDFRPPMKHSTLGRCTANRR